LAIAEEKCADATSAQQKSIHLMLDDGTVFTGRSFGAEREVKGEVVFNTGMSGYVETLTDPSYRGQILVLTYPLQANYGVPDGPFESGNIQVQGLVVSRYSARYSHHRAIRSLSDWLESERVPAIEGIDTRTLTRRLREHGTIDGYLLADAADLEARKALADRVEMKSVAELVASQEIVRYPGGDTKILVINTGVKQNIVRSLQKRGASVICVPFVNEWERMLDEVDGVVIGNGPGDPQDLPKLAERIRTVFAQGIPAFGICFGHQLLSVAAGAKTFKLKYGHRSLNQPVMDVTTGRAYVTSQNHGYAVNDDSLPSDWQTWFVNLNDGTNEGIRHRYRPFSSVQFHPEAAAGPHDTAFLFDDFMSTVSEMRQARSRTRLQQAEQ